MFWVLDSSVLSELSSMSLSSWLVVLLNISVCWGRALFWSIFRILGSMLADSTIRSFLVMTGEISGLLTRELRLSLRASSNTSVVMWGAPVPW